MQIQIEIKNVTNLSPYTELNSMLSVGLEVPEAFGIIHGVLMGKSESKTTIAVERIFKERSNMIMEYRQPEMPMFWETLEEHQLLQLYISRFGAQIQSIDWGYEVGTVHPHGGPGIASSSLMNGYKMWMVIYLKETYYVAD